MIKSLLLFFLFVCTNFVNSIHKINFGAKSKLNKQRKCFPVSLMSYLLLIAQSSSTMLLLVRFVYLMFVYFVFIRRPLARRDKITIQNTRKVKCKIQWQKDKTQKTNCLWYFTKVNSTVCLSLFNRNQYLNLLKL